MKKRVSLDINVMLDLLGERVEFYDAAAKIATLAEKEKIQIVVSALSFSTVFYILSKYEKAEQAKQKIRKFKIIAVTSDLTDKVLEKALASKFVDFEYALQYYCALNSDCDILITRNEKDFNESDIPVFTPVEYLSSLKVN